MPDLSDDRLKSTFLALLTIGATPCDAADYVGIPRRRIKEMRKADRAFALAARQAVAKAKVLHLRRLAESAPHWRSSAFALERIWPEDFARTAVRAPRSRRHVKIIRVRPIALSDPDVRSLPDSPLPPPPP